MRENTSKTKYFDKLNELGSADESSDWSCNRLLLRGQLFFWNADISNVSSRDSFAQRAPVDQELKVDTDDEVGARSTVSTQDSGSVKNSLFDKCKLVHNTPLSAFYHACRNEWADKALA